MKLLLISLLLVGCSQLPSPSDTVRRAWSGEEAVWCSNAKVGSDHDYDCLYLSEIRRDIKAIKQELTGVDTGCRFETTQIPNKWVCIGASCTEEDKFENIVKTICLGDTKEIDPYPLSE